MKQQTPPDISKLLNDKSLLDKTLCQAVRQALRQHKRAGNPIAIWRDGHVVWIPEFDDTDAKAAHMRRWCDEISRESGEIWRYLKVSQSLFEDFLRAGNVRRFQALLDWRHPQRQLLSA